MPKGRGFIEFPTFEAGYEALKRATGSFRDAFADESDTFRPHRALGEPTPAQYRAQHAAEETLPSHIS